MHLQITFIVAGVGIEPTLEPKGDGSNSSSTTKLTGEGGGGLLPHPSYSVVLVVVVAVVETIACTSSLDELAVDSNLPDVRKICGIELLRL